MSKVGGIREAERCRCLGVDGKIELDRLLNWDAAFFDMQNFVDHVGPQYMQVLIYDDVSHIVCDLQI